MDFATAERLIASRFQLRDRINNDEIVDFLPNPAQHRFFGLCQSLYEQKRPLRIISVKSRRVGFSRAADGIGCCYMFAYPNFEGRVMAQLDETAIDLMSSAALMVWGDGTPGKGLPQRKSADVWEPDREYKYVTVPHPRIGRKGTGVSRLLRASAKVRGKSRGLGFSFAHFSEAAYYPLESPFTAMLPTLAKSLDRSFAVLESTGNGTIGEGEAFYRFWQQASDPKKRSDSDWTRFFVPWTEDPICSTRQIARDIPRDDEEKVLLKAGLTKEQISWRRIEIATNHQGIVEDFNVEYPLTPEDAFIAGGTPAFAHEEREYVESTIREPRLTAELERTRDPNMVRLSPMGQRGRFKIWELPQPRNEYYIGADFARGEDAERPDSKAVGDFGAITVWNGTTGEQAASFSERIDPSKMADIIDRLGRFYRTPEIHPSHFALLNLEMNANLGAECQRLLRDRYAYPHWRFARWRGSKDDKYHKKAGSAIGWETTQHSRNLMFAAFRSSLREKGVCVRDSELAGQICGASMKDGRFDVIHGHDDVLLSALIGWIARQQWPPQIIAPRREIEDTKRDQRFEAWDIAGYPIIEELSRSEGKEIDEMMRRRKRQRDPLQGVLTESPLS